MFNAFMANKRAALIIATGEIWGDARVAQCIWRNVFQMDLEQSPSRDLLWQLAQKLSKAFDAIIKVLPPIKQTLLPPNSFDNNRGQWKSDEILNWLLYKNKPDRNTIMLAICDFDAYSDGLNFVFGQAHVFGRDSAIYQTKVKARILWFKDK